jgi:hypothetical protein
MWGDDGASLYLSPIEIGTGWTGSGATDFTMSFWFKVSTDYAATTSDSGMSIVEIFGDNDVTIFQCFFTKQAEVKCSTSD